MVKSHRKPVGKIGPVRISSEGAEFQRLAFPETKDEIEAFIVQAFTSETLPGGLRIKSVHQNRENDFDFKVKTTEGSKYLELMEIAPLENLRGSYEAAPAKYKPYDFANYILTKILGKSGRYDGEKRSSIVLLLYITDWSFTLSESVIALLQYWLTRQPHSFEYVFCYQPIDHAAGVRHLIFPTPADHWATFDPETLRENEVHNLSPLKWELLPSGGIEASTGGEG